MGEPVTKEDLYALKDDLRRETELVVKAEVGPLRERIEGFKWKFLGGVAAQIVAAVAVIFGRSPEAAHTAIETLKGVFT